MYRGGVHPWVGGSVHISSQNSHSRGERGRKGRECKFQNKAHRTFEQRSNLNDDRQNKLFTKHNDWWTAPTLYSLVLIAACFVYNRKFFTGDFNSTCEMWLWPRYCDSEKRHERIKMIRSLLLLLLGSHFACVPAQDVSLDCPPGYAIRGAKFYGRG